MDVEVEKPHQHHSTGHPWLDKMLPLSALLVSVVSIGIAVHHGSVMSSLVEQNERLVQANSLPYVELGHSTSTLEGDPRASMLAINSGVGPAQIRSVQIKVDGRPVASPRQLLEACCDGPRDTRIGSSTLLNRMLQSGQEMRYIDITGPSAASDTAKMFAKALSQSRIIASVCYCSVFEECWINASKGMARPRRVDACPMPEPQYRY